MKSLTTKAHCTRYVIISPVKDEEKYVEMTLRSVIQQTIKPLLWILVDDGSKDGTSEIIAKYAESHSFIRLVHNSNTGARKPGSAIIRAFNYGYESLGDVPYDAIVKLDCDISFEPDYFQKMLNKFTEDERLGIASGVYFEQGQDGDWKEIVMPQYHAAGACKVIRRTCFKNIGGFIVSAGWDTVDEIRAMTQGWKTGHFVNLKMHHHKPEGSGIGHVKTSIMHGEIYYMTGGSILFFVLKVFHRIRVKPYLLNASALAWGYIRAVLKRKKILVTKREATHYKSLLRERLVLQTKNLFTRNGNGLKV